MRQAGLDINMIVVGKPPSLSPGTELVIYRIIQEALTNAMRHAPEAQVSLELTYAPDHVVVFVDDDGPGASAARNPSGGHGLTGMFERVAAVGGTVTAGPRQPGPGWRVHARIPVMGVMGAIGVIRILLADDEALVRSGLRLILQSEPDIEVVGEAQDGEDAIVQTRQLQPDVVLMDVRMPRLDGVEATRRLVEAGDAHVLILTTFDLDAHLFAAIRAGASGFMLKAVPPDDLITAVRAVARGDALIEPRMTRRLLEEFARRPQPAATAAAPSALKQLTDREMEVLREIGRGLSNTEIGERLYIGEATVKTHVAHILAKLHLRDRIQAVVLAYETGLIPSVPSDR